MGGGSGNSGGGGSSGKVDYPDYIKNFHQYLLSGEGDFPGGFVSGVGESIDEARLNNPFDGLAAFDPTDYLNSAQVQFDEYAAQVAAMDPDAVWLTFTNYAKGYLEQDESETWEEYALRAITVADTMYPVGEEFVEKLDKKRASGLSSLVEQRQRAAGALADVGAERSSTLHLALALISARTTSELSEEGLKLQKDCITERLEFVNKSIVQAIDLDSRRRKCTIKASQQMMDFLSGRYGQLHDSLKYSTFLNSTKIATLKDQVEQQADLDVDEAEWDIKLWQYGANLLNFASTVTYGTSASTVDADLARFRARSSGGTIVLDIFFPGLGTIVGNAVSAIPEDTYISIQRVIDWTDPISWFFGGGPGRWF